MSSLVEDLIASVHGRCLDDRAGAILRGVSALGDVDSDAFGICLATADGHVYEVGDSRVPFCIQSISKPFTYGIALADQGTDAVDAKIDVEPSGELYNEISLDRATHRPRNPMINAGALVAASLVAGETPADQGARIKSVFSAYAGRELKLEEEVFEAQVAAGHRNRAIGHMLREFGILDDDPNIAHELYLRACSIAVSCRDLSLMGAVWANGGTNPLTGEEVLTPELTERVLSVMTTCGMYDAAGRWLAEVGMAAKSGVGGGIVAVLPGQLSIAAFSPRLDDHGNSIRAFRACRELSRELELHALHVARGARSAIRDSYGVVEAPSWLQRPEPDRAVLEEHGRRARTYEAHGDLLFAGAESVVREISNTSDELELVALDVRRVGEVAEVARRMLANLRAYVQNQGCEALLIDPDGVLTPHTDTDGGPIVFRTLAAATMYMEDRLLERYGRPRRHERPFLLEQHRALAGAPTRIAHAIEECLEPRSYADGELIVAEGDTQAGAFVLMSGSATASLRAADGTTRRVNNLTPGQFFGGSDLVTGDSHPVTIRAEGPTEALELTRERFAQIDSDDPELRAAILKIIVFEIRDTFERALRSLATGRFAPTTAR